MADKKAIIDETQFEAQYDAEAKLLLAQKPFLANILVRTVKDYMGLNPCDVEELIEGEPYICLLYTSKHLERSSAVRLLRFQL